MVTDRFAWTLSALPTAARRALKHPLAAAGRRALNDAWWSVRGIPIRNPPLPSAVNSILFVCKGNICRSPFAAARAEQLLRAAFGVTLRCGSAGIDATQAGRPPTEACEAAAAFGLSLLGHRPVTLTHDLVKEYDLTVVMEAEQMLKVRRMYPDAANRILLLPLLDGRAGPGYSRYNITDPFNSPLAAYYTCYQRIDSAVTQLLSLVQ